MYSTSPTQKRLPVQVQVPISLGELVDKISILEIKKQMISDPHKLENINQELDLLDSVLKDTRCDVVKEKQLLKSINTKLWHIEDSLRQKEKNQEFDDKFVDLARQVYITNDERFRIKSKINSKYGSVIVEEKSYEQY